MVETDIATIVVTTDSNQVQIMQANNNLGNTEVHDTEADLEAHEILLRKTSIKSSICANN